MKNLKFNEEFILEVTIPKSASKVFESRILIHSEVIESKADFHSVTYKIGMNMNLPELKNLIFAIQS